MFDRLIHHKNYKVRSSVANHERLPLDDLITLSNDESALVRGQAARNPKLPESEMRRLFIESTSEKHRWVTEDRYVQAGLAANESVPMDILEALSRIGDPVVTTEVAENPNTPEDILIELSKNKYESVRNKALQRLQMKNILPQQFNFDEE
jgi:hypothetical protein